LEVRRGRHRISRSRQEINRTKNRLDEILVYHTGQPLEIIEKDTDRDFFLSAEEAVEYGLIDKMIKAKEGVVKAK
jgi:ATP-dependent Clp protease protease subunit